MFLTREEIGDVFKTNDEAVTFKVPEASAESFLDSSESVIHPWSMLYKMDTSLSQEPYLFEYGANLPQQCLSITLLHAVAIHGIWKSWLLVTGRAVLIDILKGLQDMVVKLNFCISYRRGHLQIQGKEEPGRSHHQQMFL